MKNKEKKNIQDLTGRKDPPGRLQPSFSNSRVTRQQEGLRTPTIQTRTLFTADNCIKDEVYVNVDELNKEEELKRSAGKEKMAKTKEVSTSKTTKARLILAALIFLFIMFLFLIVITSLLLKYYLAVSEEVSHLKNHENVKQNLLQDIKAINKSLENVKQNLLQDIKAINKSLEIVSRTCPPGWTPIGLFCYYFSTDELSWDNARDDCIRKGSSLAFLKIKEEMDALKSSLENVRYWIGLRRDTEPGKWKWLDGSMLSYSNWHTGEPNNLPNENCAESWNGSWNDLTCESKRKYICKKCCCC